MTRHPEVETEIAWARGQLGLTPEDSPAQVRTAFLRRLADDAFCPDPTLDYAQRMLVETPRPSSPITNIANLGLQQAQVDRETRLRGEVEDFARQYFSLAIETRRRRCQELVDRCNPFANLSARLEALEPGLDLDPDDLTGPFAQLGRMLGELFVLRPAQRAFRRRELLEELAGEKDFWDTTAQGLKEHHADFAVLEPEFLNAIVDQRMHVERARFAQAQRAKAPPNTSEGGVSGWGLSVVCVIVLGGLLRMAGSNSDKTQPPPQPKVQVPQFQQWQIPAQPQPWQNQGKKINEDFLRKLQQELEQKKGKMVNGKMVFQPPDPKDNSVPPRLDRKRPRPNPNLKDLPSPTGKN